MPSGNDFSLGWTMFGEVMSHKKNSKQATVIEARQYFVYVILSMMLLAGTTDWLSVFVSG